MPKPDYDGSGKIVYRFRNGWTIRSIISPWDVDIEEQWMDIHSIHSGMHVHLVEDLTSCQRRAAFGGATFFSLRDPDNRPYVTIEIMPGGSIGEIAGRFGLKPKDKHNDMVYEWLQSVGALR